MFSWIIDKFITLDLEFWLQLDELKHSIYVTYIITLFLNSLLLMQAFKLFKNDYLLLALLFISFWNTLSFFTQRRRYQLLNASTKHHQETDLQKYKILLQSPNLRKVVARFDEERLLEAKKKRIQDDEEDQPSLWWRILVAIFHFLTFNLFTGRNSRRTIIPRRKSIPVPRKKTIRQPTEKRFRTPTSVQKATGIEYITQSSSSESDYVWELNVWDYSRAKGFMFCFFSPLQVIMCWFATNTGYRESLMFISCAYGVAFLLFLLSTKFENRNNDRQLISNEAFYEQTKFTNMWIESRRQAEKEFFEKLNSHPSEEEDEGSTATENQEDDFVDPVKVITPSKLPSQERKSPPNPFQSARK